MEKLAYIEEFLKIRSELYSKFQKFSEKGIELNQLKNNWSIKDLLGHINWYDNECALLMETKNLESSNLWELTPDERNNKIRLLQNSKKWSELLSQFGNNTPKLLSALENLTEEEWDDPNLFRKMPLDLKPFEIIDSNLNSHYRDHFKQLEGF